MYSMHSILYFEKEHRYNLQSIYTYLSKLFNSPISYFDFVNFSFQHSTINSSLELLYKDYYNV
jgi:hypothetical protein